MRCGYAKTHGCVGGAAGRAHCAEHRVGANPTMNTMNTGNTIDGQWHTVSHVLRKFHGTWLTRFPVLSPVFLVFPVFSVGLAHSIGSAQCAPPANKTRSHVPRKFKGARHSGCHAPRQPQKKTMRPGYSPAHGFWQIPGYPRLTSVEKRRIISSVFAVILAAAGR